MSGPRLLGYQYAVVRCVPRVDREEFVNVGVVLYSQSANYLSCARHLDRARLLAFSPDLDVEAVVAALRAIAGICSGDRKAGPAAVTGLRDRFGFLTAPRSTVVQPGPTHGGLTADPQRTLVELLARLVR